MSILKTIENMAKGATVCVALATTLPIFGAVGTITATGIAVASTIGAVVTLIDELDIL